MTWSNGAGRANEVPLAEVAAEALDPSQLAIGVDALGDDLQVERPPELDHHLQEHEVGALVFEHGDERPVDLELVDREPLQVRERAVAGPEVVERDAHAERLQLVEQRDGLVGVVDQHRFGDLEPEQLGGETASRAARAATASTIVGLSNWRGDTLTETPTPGATSCQRGAVVRGALAASTRRSGG